MRHKQQPIGALSVRDYRHGLNGYKVYACRCVVCKAAMSAYQKARYVPVPDAAPTPTGRSFWLDAPADGFTAFVEREQVARMKTSRFGLSANKPYTTDEVSR